MKTAEISYSQNNLSASPNFTATKAQYQKAVKFLHELSKDVITLNNENAVHILDNINGIQYGGVFDELTTREIFLIKERVLNFAVNRGCPENCKHCILDAKPANKTELHSMPFEDFKKIVDGFEIIKSKISEILGDKPKFIDKQNHYRLFDIPTFEMGFFYDSNGINTTIKDANGKIYDYTDLIEIWTNTIKSRPILYDSTAFFPNEMIKARMEKYAKYFNRPDMSERIKCNLSVNPFSPLYFDAYELGYRPGLKNINDLTNPNTQNFSPENWAKAKLKYDRYIEMVANMLATLGTGDNVRLLMRYSTPSEMNMKGMYLSDLKLILEDVEIKCDEILKEKYPANEYLQKKQKISELISSSIRREEIESDNRLPGCIYAGRYKDLYYSRNPLHPRVANDLTPKMPDINKLSPKKYLEIFDNYYIIIDANGDLYYCYNMRDTSVRPMGKKLLISTNGKKTPAIHNLEKRD